MTLTVIDDQATNESETTNTDHNLANKILSDVTIFLKYSRYLPELKRRETWEELVTRNLEMHIRKYPMLEEEIRENYKLVFDKKVLPSMRSMQFGGKPIEINNTRIFNCAYLPMDSIYSFSEAMFLLLSGTGVGFSVQKNHVEKLPLIRKPLNNKTKRFLIGDSIEGWADSVKVLFKSYLNGSHEKILFDFRDIRPKGAKLITSGGKAPGPAPLRECLARLEGILESKKDGERLTPLEVHDCVCIIADCVLAGGIRRAALASLFSADDEEMISAKSGSWWELHPYRARANNSAVLLRHKITKDFFDDLWNKIQLSNSGEPGIFFTNDYNVLTNPCFEISLQPNEFCNLVDINSSNIESQEDFEERVKSATFIGTLQAGYTDFHYLRDIWKKTTEKEALLGISMTGIAAGKVLELDMTSASKIAIEENKRVAKIIGIKSTARTTTVKPAGTTSLVLGCSSGIHGYHDLYFIRRIRIGKNESLYTHLLIHHPELIEDDYFRPHDTAIIKVPQKAPDNAILRSESSIDLLERVKKVYTEWIKPGHVKGSNTHNTSATISVKDNEWKEVGEWMWNNRDYYSGLSVLPFDGGSYVQPPFESCPKETYEEMMKSLTNLDLTKVIEFEDLTDLQGEIACGGATGCTII